MAVHEHGQQPVAESGEFLDLGAVAFDEVEGGGGLVEAVDEASMMMCDSKRRSVTV